ncbi:hypothetical protein JW710_04765 [Candidatus Dojkabacteria bacterium]|nr:hypothetical protein [Candidatus Dojkabacteria bacterium]
MSSQRISAAKKGIILFSLAAASLAVGGCSPAKSYDSPARPTVKPSGELVNRDIFVTRDNAAPVFESVQWRNWVEVTPGDSFLILPDRSLQPWKAEVGVVKTTNVAYVDLYYPVESVVHHDSYDGGYNYSIDWPSGPFLRAEFSMEQAQGGGSFNGGCLNFQSLDGGGPPNFNVPLGFEVDNGGITFYREGECISDKVSSVEGLDTMDGTWMLGAWSK